ncbi:MAG TPA: class E sortase, partial [Acidimicrobiales bacterium]|nr:class E sortase [Acidimicrobiales bacterium]
FPTVMLILAALALILVIGTGSILLTLRIQRAEQRSMPTPAPAPDPAATAGRRAPENVVERLAVALKRRRVSRALLSVLSIALLVGAAGMIGYPFYTNLYQDRLQSQLDRQLASPDLRDAYVDRRVEEGDSLTRIQIPRIGVDTVVVEGTTASALRAGAGHYPSTPLPCEVGNVAIAGHRTTYGKPFHALDVLEPGDRITLETPIGSCTYEVERSWITVPTDVGVVDNTPGEARLTLTTCHPKGSARQRLILTATMVSAEAFGA